jgi:hypothetical protein
MKWFKKFLEKLAKANQENFPSGEKLDCCNIQKDGNKKK